MSSTTPSLATWVQELPSNFDASPCVFTSLPQCVLRPQCVLLGFFTAVHRFPRRFKQETVFNSDGLDRARRWGAGGAAGRGLQVPALPFARVPTASYALKPLPFLATQPVREGRLGRHPGSWVLSLDFARVGAVGSARQPGRSRPGGVRYVGGVNGTCTWNAICLNTPFSTPPPGPLPPPLPRPGRLHGHVLELSIDRSLHRLTCRADVPQYYSAETLAHIANTLQSSSKIWLLRGKEKQTDTTLDDIVAP